jgi:multidrug efflux pump subunit AcrB
VVPAFVSLLCICIVFVPMFFLLTGVARFLFVPMAEAVVFAMLARSSCRARWCRPWRCICCKPHAPHTDMPATTAAASRNPLVRFQRGFEAGFERFAPAIARC